MRESLSPANRSFPTLLADEPLSQEKLWRALSLYNLYRLIVAALLTLMAAFFSMQIGLDLATRGVFFWISAAYLMLALFPLLSIALRMPRPGGQLAFQVSLDIAALSTLSYFSGGVQGNLAMLLLVSLAFAGMISRGRITLLYAALASIAMLLEHGYAVLTSGASPGQFFQAGILSLAFFAIAWVAQALSRYAIANERLAFRRGVDLSNMAEANRLMIQDMPDGVLVVDERGSVRQHNPGAERLLGYAFPAARQVGLAECSPLLEAMFAAWRQNKALGHEALRLPVTSQLVRIRFLPVERDGFWGAVLVLEDMQRTQERAQQMKLAALGRLTANIAHEVRNPLSSISYAAELLKEGEHAPAQARLLRIILENAERLNRIVQDVMQVNKRDRLQQEVLDLRVCLPQLVEDFCQTEGASGAVFSLHLAQDCRIMFDRGHFEQVWWNLCRNALRYSKKQPGSIALAVTMTQEGLVQMEMTDDGPAVAPDAEQKLFEPFCTTDANGTGLGLYIARELCEANGAKIGYRQAEAGGACFRVVFGKQVMKGV